MSRRLKPNELDAYGEVALALAQVTMQQAIDSSGLNRGTVAMRFCDSPRRRWATGHLNRLLSGDCDLTVRDLGRLLAICGFEVRFNRIPQWINQILRPMMIQQRKLKHERSSGPSRRPGKGSPELARDLRTLRNLGGNQQKARP